MGMSVCKEQGKSLQEKQTQNRLEQNWGVQFGVTLEPIFLTNNNFAHMCHYRYGFMDQEQFQS